jgi:hypothetical protein
MLVDEANVQLADDRNDEQPWISVGQKTFTSK